ncbi:hypothetical protein ACLI09_15865 [Flavobacterium sp. RHBU_24]|uniref:hypothetical protein n=1 Tax=Flavobacterium sp. RHBU_24 TaxID=3391185 RepID=UPI003984E9A1
MKKLLTLKHWQLFLPLFVVPLLTQLSLMAYLFSQMIHKEVPLPADDPAVFLGFFSNVMYVVFAVMGVVMLLHFSWQYTLGSSLHKKLPAGVNMNLGLFRAFLIIPFFYILLFGFVMFDIFSNISADNVPNFYWFALIVPLHLFSIFCMFYSIYFNAKSLKAVELQRPVKGEEFIAEFFLLWFFVIGVWILQPRINKIFEENENELTRY